MANNMKRVRNLRELRKLVRAGHADYFIALGGALISRKNIALTDDGRFSIFNGIDGSVQTLSARELREQTNIVRAIRRGAFYCEE